MEKVTVSMVLDDRRIKEGNVYPVKLRVNFKRSRKYFGINTDLTKEDFKKVYGMKPREDLKNLRREFDSLVEKAEGIANDLKVFSFPAFTNKFLKSRSGVDDVYNAYKSYIAELEQENRLGSAAAYKCSLSSLKSFKKSLLFDEVTEGFLKKYEAHMLSKDISKTTIGIYLRSLRSVMNKAIADGNCLKENYPFGKRKYVIPATRNTKKALTIEDIARLQAYKPENEAEARAIDFWLFSYYGNGLNFRDITRLRQNNIHGDTIVFDRAKTTNTNRSNQQAITIFMLPEIKAIIKRQGVLSINDESFIFPILRPNMTAVEERRTALQFIKTTNKYLKRISAKLNLSLPITTYFARHTYATILKRQGVAIELISEQLGHSSTKTTKSYLDSFETETKKRIAKMLVPKALHIAK